MSALVQQLQQQQSSQIALLRAAMPAKSSSEGGERKQVQVVLQNSTRQKQPLEMPHYDPARLKKHGKNGQPPPVAVARRNARERNRVKQVNHGFATLREHIPSHVCQSYGDRGKKLSKVETLRMAVEYIRALQRLLAEADGQDPDSLYDAADLHNSAIPSPTGSVFSGSDGLQVSNLAGDDLHGCTDESEQPDSSGFLEDEIEDSKEGVLADSKRFLEQQQQQTRSLTEQNRLTENQNRSEPRRRRDSPISSYYSSKQLSFGDEENIEPLSNRHNNNSLTATNNNTTPTTPTTTTNNNNNVLMSSFPPLLLQASPTAVLPPVKRELQLIQQQQEIDSCSPREEVAMSSSPYSAQMLIEGVHESRLEPGAQIVYVTTSADGTAAYYRHELPNANEFMDQWWEQDRQQRLGHV